VQLNGVSCLLASKCFAVGSYIDGGGFQRPLFESWDGGSWQEQPGFEARNASLYAVSCPSANACLAVGQGVGAGVESPFVERWNGIAWNSESPAAPAASFAYLSGVSCLNAVYCVVPRISTAPSNSPMPDLYLRNAVSNDDCDALASDARDRLRSDRGDRCQDSRRQFPFVAFGEPSRGLPLRPAGDPEQKSGEAGIGSARWLSLRESSSELMIDRSLASRRSADAAHGPACLGKLPVRSDCRGPWSWREARPSRCFQSSHFATNSLNGCGGRYQILAFEERHERLAFLLDVIAIAHIDAKR
jgi:hypothetical protein